MFIVLRYIHFTPTYHWAKQLEYYIIAMPEKYYSNHDSSVPNDDTYTLLPLINSNLPADLTCPCAGSCPSAAAFHDGGFS